MTRYVLRQKLIALASSYVVRDEEGRDRWTIDGRMFAVGRKLAIRGVDGSEEAFIAEKVLSIGPTFEIRRPGEDGRVVAVVKKRMFTFFHCELTVDVPGPDDLFAEGDFLDHEYVFMRGERPVARVSKRWFTLADTYGLDFDAGEDDVLLVAATIVIDQCCHEKRR